MPAFKDSEFMTVRDKELVLAQWRRFVERGFNFEHFTDRLYKHLTLHCSFIAHFDRSGFYSTYFENPEATIQIPPAVRRRPRLHLRRVRKLVVDRGRVRGHQQGHVRRRRGQQEQALRRTGAEGQGKGPRHREQSARQARHQQPIESRKPESSIVGVSNIGLRQLLPRD